jgi:hypothetical protein
MGDLESKRELGIAFHIRAKGVQKSSRKPLKFEQFKEEISSIGIDTDHITHISFDSNMNNEIRDTITKEKVSNVLGNLTDDNYKKLLNKCFPIREANMDLEDFEEMDKGSSVTFVGRRFERTQKDAKIPAIKTIKTTKEINRMP